MFKAEEVNNNNNNNNNNKNLIWNLHMLQAMSTYLEV